MNWNRGCVSEEKLKVEANRSMRRCYHKLGMDVRTLRMFIPDRCIGLLQGQLKVLPYARKDTHGILAGVGCICYRDTPIFSPHPHC